MCDYWNTVVEMQLQAEILHEFPDPLYVFLLQSQPRFCRCFWSIELVLGYRVALAFPRIGKGKLVSFSTRFGSMQDAVLMAYAERKLWTSKGVQELGPGCERNAWAGFDLKVSGENVCGTVSCNFHTSDYTWSFNWKFNKKTGHNANVHNWNKKGVVTKTYPILPNTNMAVGDLLTTWI